GAAQRRRAPAARGRAGARRAAEDRRARESAVALPRDRLAAAGRARSRGRAGARRRAVRKSRMKHVLVVEDDPHNAVLFRKILEKRAGFRVTLSEDAAEILRLAQSGDVDLIIMDVSLGHSYVDGLPVNGVELCQRIKSDPRSSGVPVMLATAHAM